MYNSLIRQGYNPNEINEAMKIASQPISQINHSAEQIKNSFNLLPIILISIVIIGIIGGGIIFFMSQNNETNSEIIHRTIESTSNITNSKGNQVGEMNTKIEADIEITTDCGDMDCFEQKFAECKSATTTSKLMDNIVYFYEIIGLKDGLCEVKSKFTANPNPEWVEKEMICKYDNTKDF
ncbi:MAG: hypothetical protein KKF89_06055 [Nanoarchaeota archaeon]|nr:hypothetical protein [Nanoarchaeota archaeon]